VQALAGIQSLWETLAQDDPMWAVLTWPKKRGGRWEPDDFFATGADEIRSVMDRIRRLQMDVPRRTALDFGCGVGRVTQALAFHFESVWGLDIAPTMIAEAERHNRFKRSCRYVVNCEPDLRRFPSGSFDFVYSCITLQHLERELALMYIREFLRLLSPHGLTVFQLPCHENPSIKSVAKRHVPPGLRAPRPLEREATHDIASRIPMHCVPRPEIEKTIADAGGTLATCERDRSAGRRWTSYRYYANRAHAARRPFARCL
jgi:SAM-dependent methyltransferase